MMPLRCGRIDRHDPHEFTFERDMLRPRRTYACSGHVVTTLAEQQWADRADFDDKRDGNLREWLRPALEHGRGVA